MTAGGRRTRQGLPEDALRQLVRELLLEVVAPRVGDFSTPGRAAQHTESGNSAPSGRAPRQGRPRPGPAVEPVALRTDADLDRFVHRLLTLFDNPVTRADLRAGRLRFTLSAPPAGSAPTEPATAGLPASPSAAPSAEPPVAPAAPVRLPPGAVTERKLAEAARAGATEVLLDRRAVLTPLAKEKARALGLKITRES